MPNKRDPNKEGVSFYIPKELRAEWKAEAMKRGMTLKYYCVMLIETARKRYEEESQKIILTSL